jgi:hypothetical protein
MIYYMILIHWYKRYRAQIPCRASLGASVCVCARACAHVPFTYHIDSVTTKGKYHVFKEGLTVQRLRNMLLYLAITYYIMKVWLLLNQNLHHFQYTRPPLDNTFSQFDPVHIAQPFLKIHFNPASASYTANLSHLTLFFNPKFTYLTHFSHLMVNGTTKSISTLLALNSQSV